MTNRVIPHLKRYLVPFSIQGLPITEVDVLIIGSGIAALRAAIEISRKCNVLIVTKKEKVESNSFYAQGGIAASIPRGDSPNSHIKDTLNTGCGLSNTKIVGMTIRQGIKRVRELIEWGANFDRVGSKLLFAMEGGHSLPRVLHKGDETGAELETLLLRLVSQNGNIEVMEDTFAIDLLTNGEVCYGALIYTKKFGIEVVLANKTILASGGVGQVYRETTNPLIATGDGVAMAYRAGAAIQDMEFVQFHPTTLYLAGASRTLVSEAVRGAGGRLIDKNGRAFMKDYNPMGDLAPRDIVSRAIVKQIELTGDTQVYLDVTHIPARAIRRQFPGLVSMCMKFGLDITKEPIPVRPSAHYMIGGVSVDAYGRTSIKNLYACGEVASSGFHGANRLASNSLLECLVFGKRAGMDASKSISSRGSFKYPIVKSRFERRERKNDIEIDMDDMKNSLKSLMWRYVGIERNSSGLEEALKKLKFWSGYILERVFISTDGWELQNMLTNAILITHSALIRNESRGVHYRTDFPKRDDGVWKRRIVI